MRSGSDFWIVGNGCFFMSQWRTGGQLRLLLKKRGKKKPTVFIKSNLKQTFKNLRFITQAGEACQIWQII